MADDDFLALARKRFEAATEDEKELREKFVADLKFASPDGDDQWDPELKRQREAAGRPAMAFPRCHTFVAQVANEARQNKPQIKFAPRLDGDKDTAEIFEGLARYIQYASDAQVAYETAIEYSAGGSFGYWRFLTEYCDDESDDLDLKVKAVLDPLAIYGILGPACFGQKPRFAFVTETISKEEYKAKYPDTELASLPWGEGEEKGRGWVGSETVRIAEYWYCEEKKGNGRRPKYDVKFCKINGFEILPDTETDWPGSSIPIIPVLGKQMIIEGKPRLSSVVRPQKSAQQLINYSKTRIAETISQSPVSPYMVAEGQDAGYEKEWATINTAPRPAIHYKLVDVAGRPAPPPARQSIEPPIQALSAFVAQEIDDLKATTGIYDASLGNRSNETSGQAIQRRQDASDITTMHFMDNLERSHRQGGDIIAEVCPKIYDTAREITILGEDEAPKIVKINQEHKDEAGKKQNYDLTKGKYDVVVTTGKAYGSKRAESFDTISQVVQTSPNMFPMVADILFRNSDMAGADQLAERFHKMLPPNLQDDQDNPLPPQAQAAVAQAQQQVQELQGQLQQLTFEKQAKVTESQGKMQQIQLQHQADMQLEDKKMQTQIVVAEIQTKAQILAEREQQLAKLESQFHDQAHDMGKQKDAHAHEAGMVATKHAQAQEMAVQQAHQQADAVDQQAANTSAQSAQDAAQSQAAQPEGE